MRQRTVTRILIAGLIAFPIAAVYCLAGIVQAGSLFTGERAQRNYEFWGSLFLVFAAAFVGCGVALVIRKWREERASRKQSAI